MLKDITLGQFFPGNSPVHRLDPRCKLIILMGYIVALFIAAGWIGYAVTFVFSFLCSYCQCGFSYFRCFRKHKQIENPL